jgi:hypothetical protein
MLRIEEIDSELNLNLKGWMSEALHTDSLLPKELRLTNEVDYEIKGGEIYVSVEGTQKLVYLMAHTMMLQAVDVFSMKKK